MAILSYAPVDNAEPEGEPAAPAEAPPGDTLEVRVLEVKKQQTHTVRVPAAGTADDLFAAVAAGHVNISVEQRFALADTRAAHEALEARQTTGSTILLP